MTRKLTSLILALLFCVSLAAGVSAAADTGHLYDDASLIDYSDETALSQKLAEVSAAYNAQIVVAIVDDTLDYDIDTFVEYAYDNMEFGYGENRDGVFLLVSMATREYRILSNGYAGVAIDPDAIDMICDQIVPYLSEGDYVSAINTFADECAYYLNGYLNGFPFDASGTLMTSLIVGIVVGLIVAFVLKGQLKSVHQQNQAHAYIKDGSMQLSVQRDIFMYRHVTRTKRETDNSSSSSRSTGSGTARSKGGGSF